MKKLTCHCSGVEIEVNNLNNFTKVVKCNCSICKRKGATMTMVSSEDVIIIKGQDLLKIYQFHTKVAKHYFCQICGIYTHHNPRSNPAMTGINLGCLEDINPLKFKDVSILDGKNHPLDKKK